MSKIKAGDVFNTSEGGSVTVIEYKGWDKILIEHNDEAKHRSYARSTHLKSGSIKNPYKPKVYGVGYIGSGDHRPFSNGRNTRAYDSWNAMLQRCYSAEYQSSKPTYKGCSVDPEWHNFQNFAEWFYKQENSTKKGFDLDKDLIVFGNKTYSSRTCSFVPREINSLLTSCAAARGDLPVGVHLCKRDKVFLAYARINGRQERLGRYATPAEAYDAYKKGKKSQVRCAAEKYKNDIHPTVYKNLINWEAK